MSHRTQNKTVPGSNDVQKSDESQNRAIFTTRK